MVQKFCSSDLEAFLDNFRCKLIHAVFHSAVENMLGSPALIRRSAVLADMLDAPISELAMGEYIDFD